MPLYKTIHPKENTTVYVWHITESFDELNTVFLTENCSNRLNGMRSELHQRGFLSVRHLLKEAGYTDDDLYYNDNGKPYLKDGKHISITHSYTFSGIIIGDDEIGIDIEKNREKIKRIAHKFTDNKQKFLVAKNLVEQLTVIWGAKESLYKIYLYGGLSFKKDISIDTFTLKDKETTGWIKATDWNKKYHIFFEQLKDFTLVYAYPFQKSKKGTSEKKLML